MFLNFCSFPTKSIDFYLAVIRTAIKTIPEKLFSEKELRLEEKTRSDDNDK